MDTRGGRGGRESSPVGSPTAPKDEFGPDTWTSYLASEKERLQKKVGGYSIKEEESKDPAGGAGSEALRPLTLPETLKVLEDIVSNQNEVCRLTAEAVKGLRRNEERQRCAAASYQPHAQLIENAPCMDVLFRLLRPARQRWKSLLNERVSKYMVLKPNSPLPKIPNLALPNHAELLEVLVEGLNSDETLEFIENDLLCRDVPSSGLEAFGLHSVFRTQVRALAQFDTLSPSVQTLREYFAELRPQHLTSSISASHMDTSIESYEEHLDTFLRHGANPEALASVLRSGVHPSMRRLYYARVFQLPIVVTDGRPLFSEHGDFQVNHFPPSFLPAYLTFATKKTRERIKRRATHSSGGTHSAIVLQPLMKNDTQCFVGDSEKYFVYQDDVEVLSTTLMVDVGVFDTKLKDTLTQMGRPDNAYLAYRCGDSETLCGSGGGVANHKKQQTILQSVLPSSATLLMAPLCNVTGDTVEQYELLSGMFSALWKRLLGPTPELAQCCWIFERLTEEYALPAVAKALRVLQHPPLLLGLQWMLTGFAEVFTPNEVLGLWDIICAYHLREVSHRSPLAGIVAGNVLAASGGEDKKCPVPSALWLLPVMAAAVFIFRAPLVERAETREQLLQVFAVTHHLKVRPLLQQLLFSGM